MPRLMSGLAAAARMPDPADLAIRGMARTADWQWRQIGTTTPWYPSAR